ncbi:MULTISPECIES: LacI family DNA-binding transcriptional regulator [unclassified Streptomyces]|uniref:LacI family DNA-binding transcriptional regulator n=1 Tax=unclassified Streptomyces TaxID=2593676 RepID=UPI001BE6C419|nr:MULTISPECIES: LacI family DNA-binding transcriptional regulator [unclassified Streptomyces]MBT2406128.1 LacI family DNA-binding transcriptional regulator [Streptomyces sp. ISL-21]MBT2458699.1 LacI family DNA-binding transcriptional regulator [Streptomyces sp. ISL-86]MBT2609186.1 LacI family DNA-binding transcriptional regulator [Streptomyces sp. ISL-87]
MPEQLPAPGSRPTLEAVAARAGVSRATASRVVNGAEGVRTHVADKVREAIRDLGYVPNQAARTLVTRRTGAVAVIIAEPEVRIFSDPFFSRQIRGISKELTAHDTQLVLLLVEDRGDYDRIERYLAGGHVDGALAFSLHTDDPLPSITRRIGMPTVYGGRPGWTAGSGEDGVEYVDADNRGGAREAVRYLLDQGRRRIAHIAGPLDQTSATDRLDGYRDVLPDGDPALIAEGDFTTAGGARAMAELLDRGPRPDAVFAANDLMATGALKVLRERGLAVPRDVAVVGFDDAEPVAEAADPPLTTVRQDIEGMGRLMARLLLRALAAEPQGAHGLPGSVITPTALVRRASA